MISIQNWWLIGCCVAVIDGVTMYRRLSGARGERVRQWYLQLASKLKGGMPAMMVLSLLGDITCPPIGLAACAAMSAIERRALRRP